MRQGVYRLGVEDVFEGDFVLRHHRRNSRLDEGGGQTRQHRRQPPEDCTVQHFALGKVRNLGRPTDVRGGWEDRVLEDRAKERVGAQALGFGLENVQQLGSGIGVGASFPQVIRNATQQVADASHIVYQEQQRTAGLDQNLRVVAVGRELVGAGNQRFFEFTCALNRGAEDGLAERVELCPGGIHHDEAMRCKESRHEAGEGQTKRCIGGVTLAEEIADRGEGEQFAGLIETLFDSGADLDSADGVSRVGQANTERLDCVLAEKFYLIDLREVVIFGRQPEDGDVRDAGRSGSLFGAGNGRSGLKDR